MKDTKKLKILAISFCYNEINFIKLKEDWCKSQDIDMYIIDNISNDGTYEYLVKNKIPNHRFDTNGEFHLVKLQKELIKTVNILKPDWVIYMGVDEFFFSKGGLRKDIEEADKNGYDLIKVKGIDIRNTGESNNLHMFNKFFYFNIPADYNQARIIKYQDNLSLLADHFENNSKNKIMQHNDSFLLFNYGNTKSAKERNASLERRRKAWDNNLNRVWGTHYIAGNKKNWVWNKNDLQDIRTSSYAWVIKELQTLLPK
jgi:hypothetical protein